MLKKMLKIDVVGKGTYTMLMYPERFRDYWYLNIVFLLDFQEVLLRIDLR